MLKKQYMKKGKTTIGFIISNLLKQGPVQVLLDIIKNLDFNKFNVVVIALKEDKDDCVITELRKMPTEIIVLGKLPSYRMIGYSRLINKIITDNDIDLIHTHCFRSLIIGNLTQKRRCHVHTVHIYPGIQYTKAFGIVKGNFISYLSKIFIKRVPYPISCSKSVSIDFFRNDKIKTDYIVNGITPEKLSLSKHQLREKLGLNKNIKYFISLGRFSPEKNFKMLVDTFNILPNKRIKLIILGEGKEFERLKSIASDSVLLLGFKLNAIEYLRACDYYVSSSLTEGMPLSVIEGMSQGLPLLLSNISAHEEIADYCKNENVVDVFDRENPESLLSKMESLLKNNISEYDVEKVFLEHFSAKRMSIEYQALYEKINLNE